MPDETVNHPVHYGGANNPYEAIKVIEAWSLGFCLGNAIKYVSRAGKKGDAIEDLKKLDGTWTTRSPRGRPYVEKIDVLDHGYVRLVDSMGSDLSIIRNARVSYDAVWRAGKDEGSDDRLLRFLWRNKHTTPFEAVTFTFEVFAPIFIFRQWHRHRMWSYNELSARYRQLPEVYYLPDPVIVGKQATKNKQGREGSDADRMVGVAMVDAHCKRAFKEYQLLLDAGWPRELARIVLPLNTYSHMFATVNLLNLMRFLTLRCDPHAQYEIRVYAEAMRSLARPIAPVAIDAWDSESAAKTETSST